MRIGGQTRVAAVIGDPVEHSASPRLHNAAFAETGIDAVYVAFRVAPADLPAAVAGFRAQQLLGVSVTIPHKQAIAGLCDELSDTAKVVGVVNCLELRDRRVIGHNTDAGGFVDSLERGANLWPAGKTALLLGAGGAARAVSAGLAQAGADVTVVARDPSKASWCRAQAWDRLGDLLRGADMVVDCTSSGLGEDTDTLAVDVSALGDGAVVASLIYHREPALLAAARARGLVAIDGAGMLVHQAARAFEIWTGTPAPTAAMWRAMTGGDGG